MSSGKTWVSLVLWAFWVNCMPADADSLYLMTARSLTTLKRNCLIPLESLVGRRNFVFSLNQKEGYLFGRRILLEGGNDAQSEAKIRGLTLQGAYLDEVTKLPKDYFIMLLSRLRKPGAKLIGTTNPDSPAHWLKKEYIDRSDELDLLDVRFTLQDNTSLEKEYVEAVTKEYTGVYYKRFILGEWVLAEGIIYPEYQNAVCNAPEWPKTGQKIERCISVDYGTQNAFAGLFWAKLGGVWYVADEYYYSGHDTGRQKTDQEYLEELDAWADTCLKNTGGKPGERLEVVIDPSAASFIEALKRDNRWKTIKAKNDVLDGIRDTGTAMHNGLIKICKGCDSLLDELAGYAWDPKAESKDAPIKVRDHACDALRYFVRTKKIVKRAEEKYKPVIYKTGIGG